MKIGYITFDLDPFLQGLLGQKINLLKLKYIIPSPKELNLFFSYCNQLVWNDPLWSCVDNSYRGSPLFMSEPLVLWMRISLWVFLYLLFVYKTRIVDSPRDHGPLSWQRHIFIFRFVLWKYFEELRKYTIISSIFKHPLPKWK